MTLVGSLPLATASPAGVRLDRRGFVPSASSTGRAPKPLLGCRWQGEQRARPGAALEGQKSWFAAALVAGGVARPALARWRARSLLTVLRAKSPKGFGAKGKSSGSMKEASWDELLDVDNDLFRSGREGPERLKVPSMKQLQADIAAAFEALEVTAELKQEGESAVQYVFSFPGTEKFLIHLDLELKLGQMSLGVAVGLGSDVPWNRSQTLDFVNKWNLESRVPRASLDDEGDLILDMCIDPLVCRSMREVLPHQIFIFMLGVMQL